MNTLSVEDILRTISKLEKTAKRQRSTLDATESQLRTLRAMLEKPKK